MLTAASLRARRKWPASLPQQPRISRCLRLMCSCALIRARARVGVVPGDDIAPAIADECHSPPQTPAANPAASMPTSTPRAPVTSVTRARRSSIVVVGRCRRQRGAHAAGQRQTIGRSADRHNRRRARQPRQRNRHRPTAPVPCTSTRSARRSAARSITCTAVIRPQQPTRSPSWRARPLAAWTGPRILSTTPTETWPGMIGYGTPASRPWTSGRRCRRLPSRSFAAASRPTQCRVRETPGARSGRGARA